MTHVFHRHAKAAMPTIDHGDGPFLIDSDGKRYLDACGGAAVSCLGHSHPAVTDAIKAQLDKVAFAHTSFFTNAAMEELADMLTGSAPGDLDMVYFVSGGSEAVEAALKLARQYFLEIGQPDRRHLIARKQSYHGNTLGALSTGGNFWRREPFAPILLPVVRHVSACYPYREQATGESDADYAERLGAELEATIQELGPETVAAFVAEPVVGATSGALVPVPGYLAKMREVCDRHGVLMIFDEVMCGMGRTGTLFACEQDGVAPDLLTIAKGLGAGYQPIGAVLVAKRIFETIRDGTGFFQHGHTYMGHPTACAASLAVQKAIRDENLLDNVKKQGAALMEALTERFGNHHHVGDIRGRGLFIGLELVRDRATKEPFDPAAKLHGKIKAAAMADGLMCYPMGGTIDGATGDHVLLAPPFIIDESHVAEIVTKLGAAVDKGIQQVSA